VAGDAMGRFNLGSTVILLFPKDAMHWETDKAAADMVQMGTLLGTTKI